MTHVDRPNGASWLHLLPVDPGVLNPGDLVDVVLHGASVVGMGVDGTRRTVALVTHPAARIEFPADFNSVTLVRGVPEEPPTWSVILFRPTGDTLGNVYRRTVEGWLQPGEDDGAGDFGGYMSWTDLNVSGTITVLWTPEDQ
jgi:hypothetical protein